MSISYRKDNETQSSSMRSLVYFIDVLAILAFLFVIRSEDQKEITGVQHSEAIAKLNQQVEHYQKEIQLLQAKKDSKPTDISDKINQTRQENQVLSQEIQQMVTQLGSAVIRKDEALDQYQEIIKDLEVRYNQNVVDLETKNKATTLQLESLLENVRSDLEKSKQSEKEILNSLKKERQTVLKLTQSNEEITQDLNVKIGGITGLEKRLNIHNEQLAAIKQSSNETIVSLEDQILKKEEAIQSLKTQYIEKENDLEQLKSSNAQLQEELNIEIQTQRGTIQELISQQGTSVNTIKNLEGKLNEQEGIIGELERIHQGQVEMFAGLKQSTSEAVRDLQGEVVGLQQGNDGLKRELSDVKDSTGATIVILEEENEEKDEIIQELEQENKIKEDELAKLQEQMKLQESENIQKEVVFQDILKNRDELKDELQKKENTIDVLEKENTEAALRNDELFTENEVLQEKVLNFVSDVDTKKDLIEKLKSLEEYGAIVTDEGEVILPLRKSYFLRGSAVILQPMKDLLADIIPSYAKTLCEDEVICKHITEVEVGGHASPVYKAIYVDPKDASQETRSAHDYNMNLSYQRAQSVFNYIKYQMHYHYQKDFITKLTDVSAHGYLKAGTLPKQLLGKFASCQSNEYECEEERYVILSFHL